MYFSNFRTMEEGKSAYRRYAKALHPDNGGNAAAFTEMSKEYDAFIKQFAKLRAEQSTYKAKPQRQEKARKNRKKHVYSESCVSDCIRQAAANGADCYRYDTDTFVVSQRGYKTVVIKFYKKINGVAYYTSKQYKTTPKKYMR